MIAWLVLFQTTLSIAVAGPPSNPEYWPVRLAGRDGYFAQEKLTVSLQNERAEAGAAEALARGQVQLAATSLDSALQLGHIGGMPPKLVFGLTTHPAVVLLTPAAQRDSIRAVSDLSGKTIAMPAPGTPEHLTLLWLLHKAGVRPARVPLVSLGERGVAGALESGQIAAGIIGDPYATRLIQDGKAVPLVDLRKRAEATRWLGKPVHAVIFARSDTTLGSAELAPLARALLKAMQQLQSTKPDELADKLSAAATGFPEDFAARLAGARESFITDGRITSDMLEEGIELARARVPIPVKVDLPRRLDRLLLMKPLEEVLGRRP